MTVENRIKIKIRISIFLFRVIPLTVRRAIAGSLARMAYHLSLKHRLIAIHNLLRSFPDKSLNEILRILKGSYASFALIVAEFSEILYLNKGNLHHWVSFKGLDHYEEACREGKGVLLFSAHFGNWEIGDCALAILTRPFFFVYRILDSLFLEKAITQGRSSAGITSLAKEHAMRPMLRLLKKGETIMTLIDQNVAAYEGVFVDFFGRQACTTPGIALMALHSGAPVLPIFTTRMPDGKYLMEIGPKIETVNSGNRDQDVLVNTQNYTRIIEDHVRKYPEQWFWVHQRWKTKICQLKQKG